MIGALRAQQAGRGGNVRVLDRRDSLPGVSAETIAELERLHGAVGNSIALHKYLGEDLPTKRRRGLDWTLGEPGGRAGAADGRWIMPCSCTPRTVSRRTGGWRCRCWGLPAAWSAFARPISAAAGQFAYASLVDLRTGKVVWFNVLQTGSQVAGIKFGDIRTPEGAAQMVERLLDRMKPGREVRRAMRAGS